MNNTENKIFKCGQVYQSGCVIYTGNYPNFMLDDNLDCEVPLDFVVKTFGETIDTILTGLDLTALEPGCLVFDPETISLNELEQLEIDKICEHDAEILALQEEFNNFNAGEQVIEIDLGCLIDDIAPCAEDDNTYTLVSILTTFKNAICDLRAQIQECCLNGGNSGTSGTSGDNGTSGSSGTSGELS